MIDTPPSVSNPVPQFCQSTMTQTSTLQGSSDTPLAERISRPWPALSMARSRWKQQNERREKSLVSKLKNGRDSAESNQTRRSPEARPTFLLPESLSSANHMPKQLRTLSP